MEGSQHLWIRYTGGTAFNMGRRLGDDDHEMMMIWVDCFLIQFAISFGFRQSLSTPLDSMHTRRSI